MVETKILTAKTVLKFTALDFVYWSTVWIPFAIVLLFLGSNPYLLASLVLVMLPLRYILGTKIRNKALMEYLGRTEPLPTLPFERTKHLIVPEPVMTTFVNTFTGKGIQQRRQSSIWSYDPLRLTAQLRDDLYDRGCVELGMKIDQQLNDSGKARNNGAIFGNVAAFCFFALIGTIILYPAYRFFAYVALGFLIVATAALIELFSAWDLLEFIDAVKADEANS